MSDQDKIRYPWREWSVAVVKNMARYEKRLDDHDIRLDEICERLTAIETNKKNDNRWKSMLFGFIGAVVPLALTALGMWLAYR